MMWLKKWVMRKSDEADDKILYVVELEKYARLLIHRYDLTKSVDEFDVHNLARAAKKLQAQYEED